MNAQEFLSLLGINIGRWYEVPPSTGITSAPIPTSDGRFIPDVAMFELYRERHDAPLYMRRKPRPDGLDVAVQATRELSESGD